MPSTAMGCPAGARREGAAGLRPDIRRIIRSAGYTLKKAREVLGSNDPDYQEELAKLQSIRPSTPDGR